MQTPGDSEGQGSLACFSPWGCKESDTTEQQQTPLHIKLEKGHWEKYPFLIIMIFHNSNNNWIRSSCGALIFHNASEAGSGHHRLNWPAHHFLRPAPGSQIMDKRAILVALVCCNSVFKLQDSIDFRQPSWERHLCSAWMTSGSWWTMIRAEAGLPCRLVEGESGSLGTRLPWSPPVALLDRKSCDPSCVWGYLWAGVHILQVGWLLLFIWLLLFRWAPLLAPVQSWQHAFPSSFTILVG